MGLNLVRAEGLRPVNEIRRAHEEVEQSLRLRRRIGREPRVHRTRLHDRAARCGQPAEATAEVVVTAQGAVGGRRERTRHRLGIEFGVEGRESRAVQQHA